MIIEVTQEQFALGIVAFTAWIVAWVKLVRPALSGPVAEYFLKRGKVKWAMRLRGVGERPGCH